ncbi:winged helix-turn-helix domain-containing protein [Streptomyces sp. BI20]|uniref:winged helix-turn-helix domain-containing protein n=1 Tax=Streptomyces sp. BI20 TaxID=3403460 RepID=UPI003C72ED19
MSLPQPAPVLSLTADEARRIALRAQGLLGAPDRRAGVRGLLRRLGAVQLDTISVLARSHELIPYARLGAVGRDAVERAYWSGGHAFEYWSHAACVLPIEEWPHFAFRRRAFRDRGHRWHLLTDKEAATKAVLERLRAEGPLTASELGGAKSGGEWFEWSQTKIAVEWLLDIGEVVCTERRGWKRVYDLPERAVPEDLFHDELDDAECLRRLVDLSGRALGVGTLADLADCHRLKKEQVTSVLADTELVPVTVEGWGKPAWAHPEALAEVPRGRHRTTLLSPFDSLIWDRARTARIFDFEHRLEAYVPAPKRVHGYFTMPLLSGGRLLGRVDPGREGRVLVAKRLSLTTPSAAGAMARALWEAASWVGCEEVRVDRASGPAEAAAVTAALAETAG